MSAESLESLPAALSCSRPGFESNVRLGLLNGDSGFGNDRIQESGWQAVYCETAMTGEGNVTDIPGVKFRHHLYFTFFKHNAARLTPE